MKPKTTPTPLDADQIKAAGLDTAKTFFAYAVKADDEDMAEGQIPDNTLFMASEPIPDRVDDIIGPNWQLANYMRNPVSLFIHDRQSLPVGKAIEAYVENSQLFVRIQWDVKTEVGATIARQYHEGFLNACSVGFSPGEVVVHRSMYEEGSPYAGQHGFHVPSPELLEVSPVPVPALQSALVVGRDLDAAETLALNEVLMKAYMSKVFEERLAIGPVVEQAVEAALAALDIEAVVRTVVDADKANEEPEPEQPKPEEDFWAPPKGEPQSGDNPSEDFWAVPPAQDGDDGNSTIAD